VLWWGLPTASMLFILLHQEQLQKNFITMTHKKSMPTIQHDITAALLQIGLHNSLRKKSSFFIIEGNQNLDSLMHTSLPMHIPVQTELINALCSSSVYQEHTALWFHFDGTIKGINTYIPHLYKNQQPHTMQTQQETAAILSAKTDCFMLFCCPEGQWTFIHDKTNYTQLTTAYIQQLCKKKIALLTQERSVMNGASKNVYHQKNL
jgi:hypothetical protein